MVEEAARGGFDDHFLAVAADGQLIQSLHRALRLAMRRAEGREIVEADQLLRRGVHRVGVERPRDLPRQTLVPCERRSARSEEHTSELQSLMRISYAVFCLKKKIQKTKQ